MVRVGWTERALRDLEQIAHYIANDSPARAKHLLESIFKKEKVITKYPYSGRIVPELEIETIREVFFRNYRIIYQILDEKIDVLTVFHSSRILEDI